MTKPPQLFYYQELTNHIQKQQILINRHRQLLISLLPALISHSLLTPSQIDDIINLLHKTPQINKQKGDK